MSSIRLTKSLLEEINPHDKVKVGTFSQGNISMVMECDSIEIGSRYLFLKRPPLNPFSSILSLKYAHIIFTSGKFIHLFFLSIICSICDNILSFGMHWPCIGYIRPTGFKTFIIDFKCGIC